MACTGGPPEPPKDKILILKSFEKNSCLLDKLRFHSQITNYTNNSIARIMDRYSDPDADKARLHEIMRPLRSINLNLPRFTLPALNFTSVLDDPAYKADMVDRVRISSTVQNLIATLPNLSTISPIVEEVDSESEQE